MNRSGRRRKGCSFYCWTPDVNSLHTSLQRAGIEVGAIEHPLYMPAGEFRVLDPDGYVLRVGQLRGLAD
jgi:hypothetical protein